MSEQPAAPLAASAAAYLMTAEPELYTVDQLAKVEPALTVGSIRWLLFHRSENGLDKSGSIVKLGRKIFIRRRKFIEWAASQQQVPA